MLSGMLAAVGIGNNVDDGPEGSTHKGATGMHSYGLVSFKNFESVDRSTVYVSECCGDV